MQDAAVYGFGDLPGETTARGRGGTTFRPGFAWVAREGVIPGSCLCLADMECDRYPAVPSPFPVLWLQLGTGCPPPPEHLREPWGVRIDISA